MKQTSITSLKKGSKSLFSKGARALIDKVSIDLRDLNLKAGEVFRRIEEHNLKSQIGYFKTNIGYANIIVQHENQARTYLRVSQDNKYITTLITNPSCFSCASDYILETNKIVPEDTKSAGRLSRVDLTLDLLGSLSKVGNETDVKFKSASTAAAYSGPNLNYLSFGKNSSGEYIKIYDKSSFYNFDDDVTRVEIQLSRKKVRELFGTHLLLFETLMQESFHTSRKNPFNKIEFIDVSLRNVNRKLLLHRQDEFRGMLKICPYTIIRRRLNNHGNFKRNYRKLLTTTPHSTQPRQHFQHGISKWLQEGITQ